MNWTGSAPPGRTAKLARYQHLSNRDQDHPCFSYPPNHPQYICQKSNIVQDEHGRYRHQRPTMEYQMKRFVVLFGDGSFSPTMPSKLSAPTRECRLALKRKVKELGKFPQDHPIKELRGKDRMVVLDIDEYHTSQQGAVPLLHHESDGFPTENVRDIWAVVVVKGILFMSYSNNQTEHSTVWNRDVNSCRNMAIIFLSVLLYGTRPKRFRRRISQAKLDRAVSTENAGGGNL